MRSVVRPVMGTITQILANPHSVLSFICLFVCLLQQINLCLIELQLMLHIQCESKKFTPPEVF